MGVRSLFMGLAMAAMLSPAVLHAQDAAYLPCLAKFGTAEALRTNFASAGWEELTDDVGRVTAARAVGEVQYLATAFPRRAENTAELDDLLVRMHQWGERNARFESILYFRRGAYYAQVQPAGTDAGAVTGTGCIMVGPDLPGVRAALDAGSLEFTLYDGPAPLNYARIELPEADLYDDLRIEAIEHLFDGVATETIYGPLGFLLSYTAAEE